MNTPRLTCRRCGRIQAIEGDEYATARRLGERCEEAGCVSDPVYRAAFVEDGAA